MQFSWKNRCSKSGIVPAPGMIFRIIIYISLLCDEGTSGFVHNDNSKEDKSSKLNSISINSAAATSSRGLGLYPHREFESTSTSIFNDEPWFDDQQHILKANRCGTISPRKIKGFWYMVGSESGTTQWDYGGDIWLYKSEGLGSNSWQKVKRIVDYEEGGGESSASCVINEKTFNTVMIHCRKKVFRSDEGPEGTYTQLPDLDIPMSHPEYGELKVGGSSLYEEDGDLYFISSRIQKGDDANRQRYSFLYKLNNDWTGLALDNSGLVTYWLSNRRESPFITKYDGSYYVFTSETKRWNHSETFYKRAETLELLSSAVEQEVVMHPSNTETIKSMGSQFCFFQDFGGGKWMFGGRRHPVEDPELFGSDYGRDVMTPANFIDGIPHVYWKYEFDMATYDFTSHDDYDEHHDVIKKNGYAPVSCEDNSEPFWVAKKNKERSCAWAKRTRTMVRCGKMVELRAQCPVTCQTFGCGNDAP